MGSARGTGPPAGRRHLLPRPRAPNGGYDTSKRANSIVNCPRPLDMLRSSVV